MDVFIHFHESMFFFVFICSGLNCDFYCVVLIMFFLFFLLFLALKNKLNFSDLRVYSSEDFHLGKNKSFICP